jgi:cytoskeleton protein RodZ
MKNENLLDVSINEASQLDNGALITAGTLLRQARENAGVDIAALAVMMKVPVKKIEALEDNKLDLLPDSVFIRALASSMCKVLKVDPVLILSKLPSNTTPRLLSEYKNISIPFRAKAEKNKFEIFNLFSKPAGVFVFTLLIGALIIFLIPKNSNISNFFDTLNSKATNPTQIKSENPNSVAEKTVAPEASLDQKVVIENSSSRPTIVLPIDGVSNSMRSPDSAQTIKTAEIVPNNTSTNVAGIVVFKARASTWIEVRDAKGVYHIKKIVEAGEVVGYSGELPISIVVGRADATDVEVRGKHFNLDNSTKSNVARFEVK